MWVYGTVCLQMVRCLEERYEVTEYQKDNKNNFRIITRAFPASSSENNGFYLRKIKNMGNSVRSCILRFTRLFIRLYIDIEIESPPAVALTVVAMETSDFRSQLSESRPYLCWILWAPGGGAITPSKKNLVDLKCSFIVQPSTCQQPALILHRSNLHLSLWDVHPDIGFDRISVLFPLLGAYCSLSLWRRCFMVFFSLPYGTEQYVLPLGGSWWDHGLAATPDLLIENSECHLKVREAIGWIRQL